MAINVVDWFIRFAGCRSAGLCCRSMSKASQAPATKEDIRMLMDHIGTFYDRTDKRLLAVEDRIGGVEAKMKEWKEEIKRHFDLVAENIRHDALGANEMKSSVSRTA